MWWTTASCLLVKGICSYLKATRTLVDVWQASETSHSKSSPGNFQHQYLAELLVNVYSYCLMVKSGSCCCVHGNRLLSNLVTYATNITIHLSSTNYFIGGVSPTYTWSMWIVSICQSIYSCHSNLQIYRVALKTSFLHCFRITKHILTSK